MTTTAPRHLGRYDLLRCVGGGGMGVVWEAQDSASKARVALKVLRELNPDAIYRFKYEFRSLCQISTHRNLIRYHELVEDQGTWYFTMDLLEETQDFISYVKGSSQRADTTWTQGSGEHTATRPEAPEWLTVDESAPFRPDQYVRPPPIPTRGIDFDRVRSAFLQLVQGVAYLHRYHRLHRDLKPSNVLVTTDGRVVLLDFGLIADLDTTAQRTGKTSGSSSVQTRHSEIMGTFDYMAPEQAGGLRLSPACDWYAVGVMLFQALTGGEYPFKGHPRVVVNWKQAYDAPSPSELRSGLPEDLVLLCRQLLQRDPTERPTRRSDSRRPPRKAQTRDGGNCRIPRRHSRRWRHIFVGRSDQLTSLTKALSTSRNGCATVVCHLKWDIGFW